MTGDIDYGALGFTLTITEAARLLDTTPDRVRDLILTRTITYLVGADHSGRRQAVVRFHPDALTAYRTIKLRGELPVDKANAARVAGYLREYLGELEPEDEYDQAVFKRAPLNVSVKRGGPRVAVSVGSFIEHMAEYAGVTLVPSIVERALDHIGAIPRRGVVPLGERGGKQRWSTWWLMPRSLLSGPADEDQLIDDVHGASLDTGESVRRDNELPRDSEGRTASPVGRPMVGGMLGTTPW